MNVLIVDDEKEIADLVEVYLKNEDMTVYKCYTAENALDCIERVRLDLALLDVMLPGISGFDICRKIREKYTFPIVMLTAKGEEMDKILGLTLGADDYITKPFSPMELVARVKAQLRRFTRYNDGAPAEQDMLEVAGLVMNKGTHECTLNEKALSLTPIEFSILWLLCENCGQVISAERLFQEVWGEKYYAGCNNTVMVHIRHLREKMQGSAGGTSLIKTVWGVGYKVEQ